MNALGALGVREAVRRLVLTKNGLPRRREDPEDRGGVDADSILPLLQILSEVKKPVPGAAEEIVAWARSGHAAIFNRQILAALAAVGGAEEGGRAAGSLMQSEADRYQANPGRGTAVLMLQALHQLPTLNLSGAEDVLLKLADPPGSGRFGGDPKDPSVAPDVDSGFLQALARLDTAAGAKAMAAGIHEHNDAVRRDRVLEAVAAAVRENPNAKVADLLRDWAPSRLVSSSASQAERTAAYAVAAGMDRETVRQLYGARHANSEEREFAAWLDGIVTAAGRHPDVADLCGKLIEQGAMNGNFVGEALNKRLIHAYVRDDADRRRRVMSQLATATPVEALAIVQAFPADAWKEERDLLKRAVERFHAQREENSLAGLAAQIAADRWMDAEKKPETAQQIQALAPGINVGRRHREPDFDPPTHPTSDDLARYGAMLKTDPKRHGLLLNVKLMVESGRISIEEVGRVCADPGLTADFLFAVARGLLARKSPEARELAEVLLIKAASGPPQVEVNFWRCVVLLAVRDEAGRRVAERCLENRDTSPVPKPPTLVSKLEALKSFLEKCRE